MQHIILILISIFLYADLDVYSNKVIFDRKKQIIDLQGSVNIKRNEDKILAENIKIELNSNKQVKKFIATEKVELFYSGKKQNLHIASDKINFEDDIYTASGNVKMKNISTNEIITANKVTINPETDIIVIDGNSSKPINIKLKLKDN